VNTNVIGFHDGAPDVFSEPCRTCWPHTIHPNGSKPGRIPVTATNAIAAPIAIAATSAHGAHLRILSS
jgi:hypothetical protein